MINENGSFSHVFDDSILTETDIFEIFGEAKHQEKDIDILGNFLGLRPFGAELDESISFGLGSVKNLKLISSTKQMLAHAESHDPSSDPANNFLCTLHLKKKFIRERYK
jgi:hypothetical protein